MNLYEKCEMFYKLARKIDDLEILKSNIGNYVHFSDSERFGISYHKNIHPGNPRGLYGIKLTPEMIRGFESNKATGDMDEYAWRKYVYIFSVSGNVLNIDTANQEELFNKIRLFLMKYYKGKISDWQYDTLRYYTYEDGNHHNRYMGKPYTIFGSLYKFFDLLKSEKVVVNEHTFINIVLRGIGYDAVETNNEGFQDGIKSQIAVLTPTSIQFIDKIINPIKII